MKPLEIWELLTRDERRLAAEAFWETVAGEEQAQAERLMAERMKFRPQSVRRMNPARKAEYLAALVLPNVPELLQRALVGYHLQHKHEMLGAFLDALGIPHERGVIQGDASPPPPAPDALRAARAIIAERFPAHDVEVYLATLQAVDPVTWAGLADDEEVKG